MQQINLLKWFKKVLWGQRLFRKWLIVALWQFDKTCTKRLSSLFCFPTMWQRSNVFISQTTSVKKKPERLNPTHYHARVQYTLQIFKTISLQWPCPECALWDKPKPYLAVSVQHNVEGQPPLLTSPRAGKSLIFIQSPPAPLPAQGWTWESPVCSLLSANFRPHYLALTNVRRGSHFHINTLRPEGKFPLQWIKGLHYCKALPLFPFLAPGVCCFFSPWAPPPCCRPSSGWTGWQAGVRRWPFTVAEKETGMILSYDPRVWWWSVQYFSSWSAFSTGM